MIPEIAAPSNNPSQILLQCHRIEEIVADYTIITEQHRNKRSKSLLKLGFGVHVYLHQLKLALGLNLLQMLPHILAEVAACAGEERQSRNCLRHFQLAGIRMARKICPLRRSTNTATVSPAGRLSI